MRKMIFALVLSVLSLMTVSAQEVENPVGSFSVIPRIGIALANVSDNTISVSGESILDLKPKSQAGFMGGIDVEYRATEYLGVSLGAYYARQGCRWGDYMEPKYDVSSSTSQVLKYTGFKNSHLDLNYIQVPLMLKAYVTPQLAVMAGAQVGFLCGDAKVLFEETDLEKDSKTGATTYKDTRDMESIWSAKKVNVAIPVGVSYEYMNVILDARYNVGLTKINKDDFSNSKNKVLSFTIGYRFTL